MCTIVVIDKKVCHTIEDLRHVLFPTSLVFLPDYPAGIPGNTCLCPVDHDATAKAVGRQVDRSDTFYWKYV